MAALLQNAVKDILQLSIVETLDEYTSTTSGIWSLTHLYYSYFYNLLIMPVLGMMLPTHQPHPKEEIYMQLLVPKMSPLLKKPHETQFSKDIDTPSDDFHQVHQAEHSKRPSKPLSGFQRDPSNKTTHTPPKKPLNKYDWPVYVPAEGHKLLSPEAVVDLKKSNTEAVNKFDKKVAYM